MWGCRCTVDTKYFSGYLNDTSIFSYCPHQKNVVSLTSWYRWRVGLSDIFAFEGAAIFSTIFGTSISGGRVKPGGAVGEFDG
jgi:hypothetical protein